MMISEIGGLSPKVEILARVLIGDCLLRREEASGEEEERGLKELLKPFQQCLQAIEMNICAVGDSCFKYCLLKHAKSYFSRSARGLLLAEEFAQGIINLLVALGEGDEQLGRMRLSLHARDITADLAAKIEKGLQEV